MGWGSCRITGWSRWNGRGPPDRHSGHGYGGPEQRREAASVIVERGTEPVGCRSRLCGGFAAALLEPGADRSCRAPPRGGSARGRTGAPSVPGRRCGGIARYSCGGARLPAYNEGHLITAALAATYGKGRAWGIKARFRWMVERWMS
jgi:hypothetical protein